ncbi:hypothetical protein L9F63_017152, partial [Diploptera punctata]
DRSRSFMSYETIHSYSCLETQRRYRKYCLFTIVTSSRLRLPACLPASQPASQPAIYLTRTSVFQDTAKSSGKKPRAKPAHPRTSEMAIKKYIAANYKVDPEKFAPFIKKANTSSEGMQMKH